ncbi:hypothetical protein MVEG_11348 [Podila verticillata NRRL 6337]|uniref:Uncharacterized protein n=1 Tax=Podila verticillata NRRL 6337 TaxID=1069443 RepID=A0A086TLJ5_9FUNG|nr:hypothetical protein MVEG_11348 [Podila verticillata NRRL 6337]
MFIRNHDACRDVEDKKRGRPKLVDNTLGAWGLRKDVSDPLSTDTTKAASLAKTRVKDKYTKSANYKMPRRTVTHTPPQITSHALGNDWFTVSLELERFWDKRYSK